MRQLPVANEGQELASVRRPIELYAVHLGAPTDDIYYYTSSDLAYTFGGITYNPAPLKRGGISTDLQFKVVTCEITVGALDVAVANLIAAAPVGAVTVEIFKTYRDGSASPEMFYSGQIVNVSAQGIHAVFKLGTYEYNLKQLVPTWRIQNFCNFTFLDDNCAATPGYATSHYNFITAVSLDGLDVTISGLAAAFGANATKLAYGFFYDYLGNYRMIKEYRGGDVIRLNRACKTLVVGNTGYVELGCNGSVMSCQAYANMANFGGHPELPIDNPCVWS